MGNSQVKQKCHDALTSQRFETTKKIIVKDTNTWKTINTYPKRVITSFLKSPQFKKELISIMNMSCGIPGNITYDYEVTVSKIQINREFKLHIVYSAHKRPGRKPSICLDANELRNHISWAFTEMAYRGTIPAHKPIDNLYHIILR